MAMLVLVERVPAAEHGWVCGGGCAAVVVGGRGWVVVLGAAGVVVRGRVVVVAGAGGATEGVAGPVAATVSEGEGGGGGSGVHAGGGIAPVTRSGGAVVPAGGHGIVVTSTPRAIRPSPASAIHGR